MVKAIVSGQKVESAKVKLAKELRRNMTPAEDCLWQALRNNRLGRLHFRRQQVIAGFIVDFYCHQAALAVEVDGEVHESQAQYDIDRDQVIRQRGIEVVRFLNDTVMNDLSSVLTQIEVVCKERVIKT